VRHLIRRYTNQQLTSAEVSPSWFGLAKEVAAEGNRGTSFTPPLSHDKLAFYDAVVAGRVRRGGPGRGRAGANRA
jgi:type I restriction enzyme, R subunit